MGSRHTRSLKGTEYGFLSFRIDGILQNPPRQIALLAILTPCDRTSGSRHIHTRTIVRIGRFLTSRICSRYRNYFRITRRIESCITIRVTRRRHDRYAFFMGIVDRTLHEFTFTATTEAHINYIRTMIRRENNCLRNIGNRTATRCRQHL